jgi:FG-GAP repeat
MKPFHLLTWQTLASFLACLWLSASDAAAQIVGGEFTDLYQWDGEKADGYFGFSVADAGDLNGDGYPDLIVGAPWSGLTGQAFAYSGADGTELLQWTGMAVNGQFGYSVAGAGDINHDGFDDVIIGANTANAASGNAAGSVFVYSGSNGNLLLQWNGAASYSNFGQSVSGVPDVNQDGYADLLIGAPLFDVGAMTAAGAAYLYSGADGSLLQQWEGQATNFNFGASVSHAGDVNLDGVPDLIIGAPAASPNGKVSAGSVYVYSGADSSQLYRWNGLFAGDRLGASVSTAGDLNGDQYADLLVGAPEADRGGLTDSGVAYVLSGIDGSVLFSHDGQTPFGQFGFSVGNTGDFNQDGLTDLLVGAPYVNAAGQAPAGSVFLYSGADASLLHSWNGERSGDHFGYSVSSAGDVNKNGRSELIISARATSSPVGNQIGSAYVYSLDPFLFADTPTISAAAGGELQLRLDFPDAAGFDEYKILISKTGIGPTKFGVDIPLSMDPLVLDTFAGIYRVQSHTHMHGTLNFYGKASASLTLPPAINPSFIGDTFYFAAISNSPGRDPEYSSTALAVTITP